MRDYLMSNRAVVLEDVVVYSPSSLHKLLRNGLTIKNKNQYMAS